MTGNRRSVLDKTWQQPGGRIMNRYIRQTYGSTDTVNNYLKTIDLAAVSAPLNRDQSNFDDQMAASRPPRRENSHAAESGQKVDTNPPSAPTKAVARKRARAHSGEPSEAGTCGPSEEPVQQASRGGHSGGARKGSGRRQREKGPNPKHQRAAEARQRYELLEEERELLDNLADFWDERFDKPRRQRVALPPWDVHKDYAPPAESDGKEAELPCAPGRRSSRR